MSKSKTETPALLAAGKLRQAGPPRSAAATEGRGILRAESALRMTSEEKKKQDKDARHGRRALQREEGSFGRRAPSG